jgi:hypothetical protein
MIVTHSSSSSSYDMAGDCLGWLPGVGEIIFSHKMTHQFIASSHTSYEIIFTKTLSCYGGLLLKLQYQHIANKILKINFAIGPNQKASKQGLMKQG